MAELRHAGSAARWSPRWPTFSGVFATKQFLVQTFRSVPKLPIGQLWQSGLDSLNLGSAKDWFLPVPSHSPSSPGGYARSGRRSRRPLSIARGWRHPPSDQVGNSSRRSKARDSARRSVTGLCSESARVRITARSLRVEDEPRGPAPALAVRVQRFLRGRAFARSGRTRSWPQEPRRDSTRLNGDWR